MRFLTITAVLLAASPAAAHAMLEEASPAVGSHGPAPAQVRLVFDSDVDAAGSKVSVHGPRGFGGVGPLAMVNGWTLAAPLKAPTPPGRYHVFWQAKSDGDGHINEGDFTFDVRP